MLDPNNKAQYKMALTDFKTKYGKTKIQFKRNEDAIISDENKQKLNIKNNKNSYEQFSDDQRQKLISGTGELNQMDNKLIDIEA